MEKKITIVIPEIEQIARLNDQAAELAARLANDEDCPLDVDGLDFGSAHLVSGCKEEDGHLYGPDDHQLDAQGLMDDLYYCQQHVGYCEDDFYGELYFKTAQPGVFVEIHFEM